MKVLKRVIKTQIMLKIKHGNLALNASTSLLLVTKKKVHYTKNLKSQCLLELLVTSTTHTI